MSTTSVWVRLYIGQQARGFSFEIKPMPSNISELRDAVEGKCAEDLVGVSAHMLQVYGPGYAVASQSTDFPVPEEAVALKAGIQVSELPPTGDETPLIVVAPEPSAPRPNAAGTGPPDEQEDINAMIKTMFETTNAMMKTVSTTKDVNAMMKTVSETTIAIMKTVSETTKDATNAMMKTVSETTKDATNAMMEVSETTKDATNALMEVSETTKDAANAMMKTVSEANPTAETHAMIETLFENTMKQHEESETLLISKPESKKFDAAMSRLGVPQDAPRWIDKPSNLPSAPPHFAWLKSEEDSPANRKAYMDYLRNPENLVLPQDTVIFDGASNGELLSVRIQGFGIKTSGNIDVPLAGSRHQTIATVKENMLGAFELKKDTNREDAKIDRQAILQHMAASYLNPDIGVLTVMTDLNDRWHFYWFIKGKRLMRYDATPSEARFLIEHMLDKPESISTPTGFLSRASWNSLFVASIAESPEGVVPNDSHDSGEEDNDEDGNEDNDEDGDEKEERSLSHQVGALSLSANQGTNAAGKRRAASNEEEAVLSSLDFMDEEEELEAVLHMATRTMFHRMFGPPQEEAGNCPPSRIEC